MKIIVDLPDGEEFELDMSDEINGLIYQFSGRRNANKVKMCGLPQRLWMRHAERVIWFLLQLMAL